MNSRITLKPLRPRQTKVFITGFWVWLLAASAPSGGAAEADSPPPPPVPAGVAPAAKGPESLKKMSLEELLNVPVQTSGTLTPISSQLSPAAVTVITAEDIRLTPHRNLLDLAEVYVPGAMVFTHSDGMKLGLRGIVSDRNVKFLLLVNGANLNQRAHSGAAAELTNWDLNDIDRIEIIRGPGSVTYGPGAIAGVVNIITKTGAQAPGFQVNWEYLSPYDAKIGSLSYGLKKENIELFAYASIAATSGWENPRAYSMESSLANGYGYVGTHDFSASTKTLRPPTFMRDFEGEPQYKAFLDLKIHDEWRFWDRFTSSGSTADERDGQGTFQQGLDGAGHQVFGDLVNFRQIQIREAAVQLENKHEFNERFTLESSVGLVSQDYDRRNFRPLTYTTATAPPVDIQQQLADPGSVRNVVQNFSEDDLTARVLGRLKLAEQLHAVLGAEYVLSHFGPGWFDDPRDFRMGESGAAGIPNVLSGPDSRGLNPAGVTGFGGITPAQAIFVGKDGWATHTCSLLGEATWEPFSWLDVILSGRLDKHPDTDFLYSPRLALVTALNKRNYLKLNLQQSVRMDTGEQLLAANRTGAKAQPEELRAIELSYDSLLRDNLHLNISGFYDELEVLGWTGAVTSRLGKQKHAGAEFELAYSAGDFTVGLNHSFVKLLDWDLAPGISGAGVSFVDYNQTVKDSAGVNHLLTGTGRDLHNWANNATKLYLNYHILKNLTFHTDLRVFWGMDGAEDQFAMIERAAAGSVDQAAVAAAVRNARDHDAFALDFRLNLSLTYDVKDWLSIQVFALNVLDLTHNKRYDYDTGTRNLVPRVYFVEEPLTVGVLAKLKF